MFQSAVPKSSGGTEQASAPGSVFSSSLSRAPEPNLLDGE